MLGIDSANGPIRTNPHGSSAASYDHGFARLRSRLVKRFLGASIVVIAVALLVTIQASSSPAGSGDRAAEEHLSKDANSVVIESTKEAKSSDKDISSESVNSTTQSAAGSVSNDTSASVNVSVNGQAVSVPENGSTQQTFTTPDGGSASISITNNTSGSGSSFSSSFTSTNQNSSSFTSMDSQVQQSFNSP